MPFQANRPILYPPALMSIPVSLHAHQHVNFPFDVSHHSGCDIVSIVALICTCVSLTTNDVQHFKECMHWPFAIISGKISIKVLCLFRKC